MLMLQVLLVRSQMEMRNTDERWSGYKGAENLAELCSAVGQPGELKVMDSDI